MKKLTMALVVGALVFSLAGIASAVDINIYGASAQVSFWAAEASAYLKDAAGAACGAADLSACGAAVCGAAVCPSPRLRGPAIMEEKAKMNTNITMVLLSIKSPGFQASNLRVIVKDEAV